MQPATVWFNKNLNNTWQVLALIRAAREAGEFRLLGTHSSARYPGRRYCDVFEQEPDGLGVRAYVEHCLDVARRHRVTHFFPGHELLALVRARPRFEAIGTRLVAAAEANTLDLLRSKARLYRTLAGEDFPIPDYAVVNDLAGFDAAFERLRSRRPVVCYKPAVSVYGIGFRIVAERGPELQRLRARDPLYIGLDAARRRLAAQGRFRDLLVMEYLPDPERSVDCLARHGQLLRCVVRRKEEGFQVIETNPALVAMVRRLTARFRLHNLFNVQFKDADGRSYLLEINPRMSGGLPFACRSGLVLPYWAIRLALGSAEPDDVPVPRAGVRVLQPERAVSV